jgi:hypothetical protein
MAAPNLPANLGRKVGSTVAIAHVEEEEDNLGFLDAGIRRGGGDEHPAGFTVPCDSPPNLLALSAT